MSSKNKKKRETSAEDLLEKIKNLQDDSVETPAPSEPIQINDEEITETAETRKYEDLKETINNYQISNQNQLNSANNKPKKPASPYDKYSINNKTLESEIEEAEQFVLNATKSKHSEQVDMPMVDNIDNYSPEVKTKKKSSLSSIFKLRKKGEIEDTVAQDTSDNEAIMDFDSDNTYVEELEDTAELIAFEPSFEQTVDSETDENEQVVEDEQSNEDKSSETAIMMMALGYSNPNDNQNPSTTINFNQTDTMGITETNSITKTSVLDKIAREELQNDTIENVNNKNRAIYKTLNKKHSSLRLRLFGVSLLSVLLLVFEFLAPILKWTSSPFLVYIGIDLVLLLAIAALSYDKLIGGLKQIFKFSFDSDVLTLITFLISLAFSAIVIVSYYSAKVETYYNLYNSIFSLNVIISFVMQIYNSKKNIYSYRVASSKKIKRALDFTNDDVLAKLEKNSEEVREVKETKEINDFFARKDSFTKTKHKLFSIVSLVYVLLTAGIFVYSYMNGMDLYTCITKTYIGFALLCPCVSIGIIYYPLFTISKKAYYSGTAVLGDGNLEKNVKVKQVVFKDLDLFPSEKIKLKSVNIYNSAQIEDIIYYTSSVFAKVGGPLDYVFRSATLDSRVSSDVEINSVVEGGIDAYVDGRRIIIGRPQYMRDQYFETVQDEEDELYMKDSNKRVMYIACNDEVLAKYYIQYSTTKEFIRTATYLSNSNISIAVKTADPCIDLELLRINRLSQEKYNIEIINGLVDIEPELVVSAKNVNFITTGSTKSLIKTFISFLRFSKVYRSNLIFNIIAILVGLAVTVLSFVFKVIDQNMLIIYPLLFETLWFLTLCIKNKFEIK